MAATKMSPKGLRWGALGVAVLLAAGAAAMLSTTPVMTARITLSADGEDPVTVYEGRTSFRDLDAAVPLVTEEIDLARWAGKLLRVEVEGSVRARSFLPVRTGHVGYAAELVGAGGTASVDVAGWPGESVESLNLHPTALGSPVLVSGGGNPSFVHATNDHLWHVLRVPPGARLRVSLRPLRGGEETIQSEPARAVIEAPSAASAVVQAPSAAGAQPARRPDVFIYLIDTLRADHLGGYGYDRGTSPEIDAFAREATLYEEAQTSATWTRPVVASLLSGLTASVHGAVHEADGLAEWPVLLPEILQDHGYTTRCLTANGIVSEYFGFDQGYDSFLTIICAEATWLNAHANSLLSHQDPEQPVFLFVHTLEPHDPYTPTPASRERFDRGFNGTCDGSTEALDAVGDLNPDLSEEDISYLIDLYDAEIFDADQGFRGFLDVLRRTGRYDNSLLIFLSDHGESFLEHDTIRHGFNLNREELHVPLIIRFPGGRYAGLRVSSRVGPLDLLPTILRQVGIDADLGYSLVGSDIAPGSAALTAEPPRRSYCEISKLDSRNIDLVGVIDEDGFKRVVDLAADPGAAATARSLGLWDTRADPQERDDLSAGEPVRAAYDDQLLAHWLLEQRRTRTHLAAAPPPTPEISDELRDQLRGLGYMR